MPIISVDDLEVGGITLDRVPRDVEAPILTDGLNVRFQKGAVESSGYFGMGRNNSEVGIVPYGMFVLKPVSDPQIWFAFDSTKAHRIQDGVDVTGADFHAGSYPTWTGGVLGGVLIVNNDGMVDKPRYYNLANEAFEDLTGFPDGMSARAVRFFKQYAFALNLKDQNGALPYNILNSHPAEPGHLPPSWDIADPTTLAGMWTISETPGYVVDGLTLGNEFFIYKEDSTWAMREVGGVMNFAIEKRFDMGMLHTGLVVEFERQHFVVSKDDIWVHDGRNRQSIIYDLNRDSLFNAIDPEKFDLCRLEVKQSTHEVWFFYPTKGADACDRAAIWDWTNGTWTFIDVPPMYSACYDTLVFADKKKWSDYQASQTWANTMDEFAETTLDDIQSKMVLGGPGGVWIADSLEATADIGLNRMVERRSIPVESGKNVNLSNVHFISEVFPKIDVVDSRGDYSIRVYVGGQIDTQEPIKWDGPLLLIENGKARRASKVNCRISGRYLSYRIVSDGECKWRLTGLNANVSIASRY